jgi:hypothetical protein
VDSDELRRLLAALTPMVASCRERLSVEHLGKAICGLRGMASSPERVKLAAVLKPRLLECSKSELETIQSGVYC